MMKKVRIGIVGAGDIARKFAHDVTVVSNTELVAVASRTIEKAQSFATEFQLKYAFGSYQELANSDEIDAVYIATPHNFHKEQTLLFLNNKKHVLCEKPISINVKELKEMLDCAKRNNKLLMKALWTWYLPSMNYVKDVVESHKYGELKHMDLTFGFNLGELETIKDKRHLNINLAGGSLLDVGIYPTSVSQFLKEVAVKELNAKSTFYNTGVDLTTDVNIIYEDNTTAALHAAFNADLENNAVLQFENGEIIIPNFWRSEEVIENGIKKEFPFKATGFEYEIESFSNTILSNKLEDSVMSYDNMLKIMRFLDLIREKVNLKYPNE